MDNTQKKTERVKARLGFFFPSRVIFFYAIALHLHAFRKSALLSLRGFPLGGSLFIGRASLSMVYSDKPTERATRRTSARMGDKLPSHFSRFRLCDPFHVKSIYSGKNTLISPSILPLR